MSNSSRVTEFTKIEFPVKEVFNLLRKEAIRLSGKTEEDVNSHLIQHRVADSGEIISVTVNLSFKEEGEPQEQTT